MFFDSRGVVSGHRRDRSHDQSLLPRHETPVKFSDLDSHTVRARDIEKKASRQARENNGQKKQNLYC